MTMSSRVLATLGIVLCALGVTVAAAAAPVIAGTTAQTQPQPHPQQSHPPVEGKVDIDPSDLPGDGSESNPYEISNVSELQAMEDDLDANYELVSDIDASQTAQFNDGRGFDPVGDGSGDFQGNFDGNGFQITQLIIDRGTSGEEVGLFGEVDSAVIESVHLDSVDITGNRSVGALAGFLEQDTTVRRVSANGSVSGEINTGGLIGAVEDSTVKAASTTGSVTGSTDVGGLAGQNVGGIITQSSSQTTVTATGEQQGSGLVSARAGGLIGGNFNNAITNQSYATGSVSGRKVGGITGENYNGSQISHTYATGSVDERTDAPAGGVVGDNLRTCPFQPDSQLCDNYEAASVADSYWDTEKTGQSTSDGSATGLTTAEMQGQAAAANMNGFDFDNTWTTTSEYPALRVLSETDKGNGSGSGGDDGPIQVDVDPSDLPGDGSESTPYEISNISELQAMENDLDANYELVSDIDASQTAQFNDGAGFDPVGGPGFDENTPPPFTGTFDGNNQTITDLTITRSDERYVGLFGAVGLFEATEGATLADVTLANVTATGNRDVGGLVGRNFANITDATASGNVTGERFVGGVAGSNDGTITDVTTSGNVTGVSGDSGDSGDSLAVGGLVGVNRGNVTATVAESVTVTSDRSIGGLVGSNSGNITDATASGSVNGTERVGGLVGSNFVSIIDASASVSVTGDTIVGGLVGENGATITDTFAVGSIVGTDDVGGLVGQTQSDATVEQSYFDIQATGQTISAGGIGLTTTEMQGPAAAENMDLAFGETWQTVSGNYPELIALSDSDTDSDSGSGSETSPTVSVSRSPSSSEIAPGETVTLTTKITGASGSVSTSSTYEPSVASATVRSVTVNGASTNPILSEATTSGSTVTLGDVGTDATVTITEELTVSEELNVTHQITGDVTAGETTTEFEPVSVTVTDIEPQSPVDEFDTDGNGDIEITELGQAGQAFASGQISITELGEVGAAFAS